MASIPARRLRPQTFEILSYGQRRCLATVTQAKKEGDISSVFVSLSGNTPKPLPPRFADVKRALILGRESELSASWNRLLNALQQETKKVEQHRSSIIPSIKFDELHSKFPAFQKNLKEQGVGVIRGVVPREIARSYKEDVQKYVKDNPSTRAFPPNDPQVFELYWSPSQVRARSHPNLLYTQRMLMETWRSKDPEAVISASHPVSYADRVRIRQPGDAGFALGPHVDAGSVERWEKSGYGLTGVYDKIWEGDWENYDPWESSCRLAAKTDLYDGPGACSMFRMFQGWLSMSWTGPNEGTLLVNPMLRLATAYFLLRPFFNPIQPPTMDAFGNYSAGYLDPEKWTLESEITPLLQGATPSHSQELDNVLHPHLNLSKNMVPIPKIEPGDYVVWHCDSIHAVDKIHQGSLDSSVLYIPACPLTEANAQYLTRQRDTFLQGTPGPDFPGGPGESQHIGRPTVDLLKNKPGKEALRAMGLEGWSQDKSELSNGQKSMLRRANEILGFENAA